MCNRAALSMMQLQDHLEAAASNISMTVSQALALGSQMLSTVATAWAFLHASASTMPQKPAGWWDSCSREHHLANSIRPVMPVCNIDTAQLECT